MGQAQMKRSRKIADVLVPIPDSVHCEALGPQEWRKDLLVSWLFQTSIRLQTSLDRLFVEFGMTFQEASVLLRCVEAQRITPGQLAVTLERDKGNITRFIDRLQESRLVTRERNRHDQRLSVIKPTRKGKRLTRDLAPVFDSIRKEFFAGILESDVRRLGQMLTQLRRNAVRIGSLRQKDRVRGRRRRPIGNDGMKLRGKETSQRQVGEDILTPPHSGHAANTLGLEQDGGEHKPIRSERCDDGITGKLADQHEELILK
jgi:DNA-binding MarR family transcriptional regulator